MNGILLAATIAVALIFSNCLIMEGETPDDNSEVYVAWAYSPSRCQQMLDKEAGHHVVITEHGERILRRKLTLIPESATVLASAYPVHLRIIVPSCQPALHAALVAQLSEQIDQVVR